LRLLEWVTVLVDQKPGSAQEIDHAGTIRLQFKQDHKGITRNGK
jgi:hypothetical protein